MRKNRNAAEAIAARERNPHSSPAGCTEFRPKIPLPDDPRKHRGRQPRPSSSPDVDDSARAGIPCRFRFGGTSAAPARRSTSAHPPGTVDHSTVGGDRWAGTASRTPSGGRSAPWACGRPYLLELGRRREDASVGPREVLLPMRSSLGVEVIDPRRGEFIARSAQAYPDTNRDTLPRGSPLMPGPGCHYGRRWPPSTVGGQGVIWPPGWVRG